jgi:hypothetical protein
VREDGRNGCTAAPRQNLLKDGDVALLAGRSAHNKRESSLQWCLDLTAATLHLQRARQPDMREREALVGRHGLFEGRNDPGISGEQPVHASDVRIAGDGRVCRQGVAVSVLKHLEAVLPMEPIGDPLLWNRARHGRQQGEKEDQRLGPS